MDLTNKNIAALETQEALRSVLKFYDESKVEPVSFTPAGSTNVIRGFKLKGQQNWINSRSKYGAMREEFIVAPEMQLLLDNAQEYGIEVDDNLEYYVQSGGKILPEQMMEETIMTVENFKKRGFIWVARSQMICHPEGYVYGEVDEIVYEVATDTYYVVDTKTSSSVNKIGYQYQLATYIEILRLLNPTKKFSSIAIINWVKVKKFKWVQDRGWEQTYIMEHGPIPKFDDIAVDGKVPKDHPIYDAKWSKGAELVVPEKTQKLVEVDVYKNGVINLVKADWHLINILVPAKLGASNKLPDVMKLIETNEELRYFNQEVQNKYNAKKVEIEK